MIKRYISVIKIINEISNKYVGVSLVSRICTFLNTYLVLYINKLILDKISFAIFLSQVDMFSVIKLLLVCGFIEICTLLVFNCFNYHLYKIKLKYDDEMAIKLAKNFSHLDLSYYDDPNEYNRTIQIGKCKTSILELYNYTTDLIFNLLSFSYALYVIVRLDVLLSVFVILASIPGLLITKDIKTKQYVVEKDIVPGQRLTDSLLSLFYNRSCEMELQIYNFSECLIDKIMDSQSDVRKNRIVNKVATAKKEILLIIVNKALSIMQQIILIYLVIVNRMTIGDYSYYSGVVKNLSASCSNISTCINNIHLSIIKYDEFNSIISRKSKLIDDGEVDIVVNKPLTFEFQNVSFMYPNTELLVLDNVSFKVVWGEKIALVGKNGAGKTTLIKLLLRFYDPTEGKILLNGVDIKKFCLKSYRSIFSAMFQDGIVYPLSIKENITISDTQKEKACIDTRVLGILNALNLSEINGKKIDIERKYGKEFDINGYVFSKGQHQRLQCARTLFREASVYILDEPSSSLDAISEHNLLNALDQYTYDKTKIYITHRYHNLHTMDQIFVFDNGKIVGNGTHEELMQTSDLYKEMFDIQSKDEMRV